MATKNVSLQMKINNVITDIMVKTGADNVVVNSTTGELLSTRLTQIATDISNAVAGGVTLTQVDARVNAAIDNLIDGAPEAYNTLKEISDYISSHQDVVDALNAAIGNKVDKVSGKGLSTNDFTTALKTKLETTMIVRSGSTTPTDLGDGELFIKID